MKDNYVGHENKVVLSEHFEQDIPTEHAVHIRNVVRVGTQNNNAIRLCLQGGIITGPTPGLEELNNIAPVPVYVYVHE